MRFDYDLHDCRNIKGLPFWERYFGGHIVVGKITFFGANAMHWAINIETRWGHVCFRLPFRCMGKWWPLYFYISKDSTPTGAHFFIGNPQKFF